MPKLIRITTAPISLNALLRNQMKFMQQNDFDVIMVSSNGKEWPTIIENEKCKYKIIPMQRAIAPWQDLKSLHALYKLFKLEKPDIVHSHTPKAGLLAMLAAKAAGVKIRIHTIAGLRFMTANGLTKKILIAMEKLTGNAAQHVWPNSFSLLNFIKQNKLISDKKLHVIGYGSSNGVDINRYSRSNINSEILNKIKNQISFDENFTYLLSMGRIVKDKGIVELLSAFIKCYQQNNRLKLILLGSFENELDPLPNDTLKLLHNHPAIIHIEWSEYAEYFMYISSLIVHPSYREGFPSSLLQAGAMECPIVCSNIEGNIDIVVDHKTGLLFKPKNELDLFEKLNYALNHQAELKIYATNLRQKVIDCFSQKYLHESLKNKYLQLLNEKN